MLKQLYLMYSNLAFTCLVLKVFGFEQSITQFYFWFEDKVHDSWILESFEDYHMVTCLQKCRRNFNCTGLALGPVANEANEFRRTCHTLWYIDESDCKDDDECKQNGFQVFHLSRPLTTTTEMASTMSLIEDQSSTLGLTTETTTDSTTSTKLITSTAEPTTTTAKSTTTVGSTTMTSEPSTTTSTSTTESTTSTEEPSTTTMESTPTTASPSSTTTEPSTTRVKTTTTTAAPSTSTTERTTTTTEPSTTTAGSTTTTMASTSTTPKSTTTTTKSTTTTTDLSITTQKSTTTTDPPTTIESTTTTDPPTTTIESTTIKTTTEGSECAGGMFDSAVYSKCKDNGLEPTCDTPLATFLCRDLPKDQQIINGLTADVALFKDSNMKSMCKNLFRESTFQADSKKTPYKKPFDGTMGCDENEIITSIEVCYDDKLKFISIECSKLMYKYKLENSRDTISNSQQDRKNAVCPDGKSLVTLTLNKEDNGDVGVKIECAKIGTQM